MSSQDEIQAEYTAALESLQEAVSRFCLVRKEAGSYIREKIREHHDLDHFGEPMPEDLDPLPVTVLNGFYLGTLETYLDEDGDAQAIEGFYVHDLLPPTVDGMLLHAGG